ncbi:MAG: hypothetical protein QOK39_1378, partial [Acidimicrobiaceae bacterium]|nr:hypothetical protein [Acidimicrobiaceae bacterium]
MTDTVAPAATTSPGTVAPIRPDYAGAKRGRSASKASREAFVALMQRDLTV